MTDLRNYEIVLGKMLGSLLQILLLLLSVAPLFAFLLLLGGVSPDQVIQALAVTAATALAAGSLGTAIALWRDKTFQTLAMTVLSIVAFICIAEAISVLAPILNNLLGASADSAWVGVWQQHLSPFRAMESVVHPRDHIPIPYAPAYGYTVLMLCAAMTISAISIWRIRVWNPRGEPIQQREAAEETSDQVDRAKAHAAPGRVRNVWANPILWREMMTRAYGRKPLLIKLGYLIIVGVIAYYSVSPVIVHESRSLWNTVWGMVPICILSLLLISAQAVTAVTSEKDNGAINLLLVTDLTPGEFIFGKLLGILWNSKEFLVPPLALAIIYGVYGCLSVPADVSNSTTATICLGLTLAVLMAFTMVLGIYVALRTSLSRLAIVNTLGTVFFLSVGTLVCIGLILVTGTFVNQWLSFVFFLGAGIGGMWWVLCAQRPSSALNIASFCCPLAVFYAVLVLLTGKPGTRETADPLYPFLVVVGAFGFTIAAMMIPLLSEFDVAMGRTTGEGE